MVTFFCFTTNTTSATWYYRKTNRDRPVDICNVKGDLMNGFRAPRFSLKHTASEYHFVIANLTTTDSGFYICMTMTAMETNT